MITRIVRMEISVGKDPAFVMLFDDAKSKIRAQEGCLGLELLREEKEGQILLWTISRWASEEALEQYRSSDLFLTTWTAVKPLFTAKAQAWTLSPLATLS